MQIINTNNSSLLCKRSCDSTDKQLHHPTPPLKFYNNYIGRNLQIQTVLPSLFFYTPCSTFGWKQTFYLTLNKLIFTIS